MMGSMDCIFCNFFMSMVVLLTFVDWGLLIIDWLNFVVIGSMLSGVGCHELNVEVGVMMLFGEDVDVFYLGVGVGL